MKLVRLLPLEFQCLLLLELSSKERSRGINNPHTTKLDTEGPTTGESRLGQRLDVFGREVQKR